MAQLIFWSLPWQVHRSEMIRKFMHLERSEYWEASDADWLYSAIYDVDVITGKASLGSTSKHWINIGVPAWSTGK